MICGSLAGELDATKKKNAALESEIASLRNANKGGGSTAEAEFVLEKSKLQKELMEQKTEVGLAARI
jgi:hypothetical protein